jgi:hypothetical protein
VWRSLVARFVRDEEAAGPNPVTPTTVTPTTVISQDIGTSEPAGSGVSGYRVGGRGWVEEEFAGRGGDDAGVGSSDADADADVDADALISKGSVKLSTAVIAATAFRRGTPGLKIVSAIPVANMTDRPDRVGPGTSACLRPSSRTQQSTAAPSTRSTITPPLAFPRS